MNHGGRGELRSKGGISPTVAAAGVAAWLVAADNLTFWRTFIQASSPTAEAFGAGVLLALVLWLLATAALSLLGPPRVAKVLWAALLLVSAVAAHFVDSWGVLIDQSMVRNVLQTDVAEASDLLSASFALDVVFRGLIPAAIVLWLPLRSRSLWHSARALLLVSMAAAATLAAALAAFYPTYAPTFRNHRELRLQLVPSNYLRAAYGLIKPVRSKPFEAVATDARRQGDGRPPLLLVLVVGETARADNFSLGGYERPTNASLDGKTLVYFSDVTSCGTDTATSVPCMFSDLGASKFSVEKAGSRENVLDVLKRTGVHVQWIENNSGCKGVCDRVPTTTTQSLQICKDTEDCLDDSLVAALKDLISSPKRDALIVLHQRGSHGPAYFKRYPAPGAFNPACMTNRLQECDRNTVVNAYDSSIDYTSDVLARKIEVLAQVAPDREVVMLYVSDHGESLGEGGIYLHGMPKWIAPHEQSHVPMLAWMNETASRRLAPDAACLSSRAKQPLTHDNLFHTLLGAFHVSTKAYAPELDVFAIGASCPRAMAQLTAPAALRTQPTLSPPTPRTQPGANP